MHEVISESVKSKIIQMKKRQRWHIERKLRVMMSVGGHICSALKDCSNEKATIMNIIVECCGKMYSACVVFERKKCGCYLEWSSDACGE